MQFTWLEAAASTMDEARDAATDRDAIVVVATARQTQGRGSRGRSWRGCDGNLFMTLALPVEPISIPLTLVPLRIGTLIAPLLQRQLDDESAPRLRLKWPNDILIGDCKVAGILIETSASNHLLVGVGINVAGAPPIPSKGSDSGRPATCLAEHQKGEGAYPAGPLQLAEVQALGRSIAQAIVDWFNCSFGVVDSAELVIAEWSGWVDWGSPLFLRDEGVEVVPQKLERDGTLRVTVRETGESRILVADYLY